MATATKDRRPPSWVETNRRVRHPLHAVRGYIRWYVILESIGLCLLYVAAAFWVGLAIDWGLFQLFAVDWIQELQDATSNNGVDVWLRASILVIVVIGLFVLVVTKMFFRLMREFSDEAMALLLERRFRRQLGDRLITAVELANPKLASKYGYSLPLVEKTISDAAERVERVPVKSVFNWRRLAWIYVLWIMLTVGLYLALGTVSVLTQAAKSEEVAPVDFVYRFNDTAMIWVERNLLFWDSYWPRSAYLEVLGFEGSEEHPNRMRIGAGESRSDLRVRAVEWVTADHTVTGGWRPMRWSDLDGIVDADLLARVKIPASFNGWALGKDDESGPWQDWTVDQVFEQYRKKQVLAQLIEKKYVDVAVEEVQLKNEDDDGETRTEKRQITPLGEIYASLKEKARDPSLARRLRQLQIPEGVTVYSDSKTKKEETPRPGEGGRYSIGLGNVTETTRFTVNGLDYYTPYKFIVVVPPPSLAKLTVDREEPAYVYYRLQGRNQMPLKGKKRIVEGEEVSLVGVSDIDVPQGSNIVLNGTLEEGRRFKEVLIGAPEKRDRTENEQDVGARVPDAKVVLNDDRTKFTLRLSNLMITHDFILAFRDEDNVLGRRRVRIRVKADALPEIFDFEMVDVMRKPWDPSLKPGEARPDGVKSPVADIADCFLITPDAFLPFRGTITDDYSLTRANWQVKLELTLAELTPEAAAPGKDMKDKTKDKLVKLPKIDVSLPLEVFEEWLRRQEIDVAVPLSRVGVKEVSGPLSPARISWQKDPRGQFHMRLLNDKLKQTRDPFIPYVKALETEPQLHYFMYLSLAAADNNVETGPGLAVSKNPVKFLIISEKEFLQQVAFEEEKLGDDLDEGVAVGDERETNGVVKTLKAVREILDDQARKLGQPKPSLADVKICILQAQGGVNKSAVGTRAVHEAFRLIREQLYLNNITDKWKFVKSDIIAPLDEVLVGSKKRPADFNQIEESLRELYEQASQDARDEENGVAVPSDRLAQRRRQIEKTRDMVDVLVVKLYDVVVKLQAETSDAHVRKVIEEVHLRQKRAAEVLERFLRVQIDSVLNPAPPRK